ncbi:MAG: hypothetical protein R3B40_13230 [Polyangiales bacterium]|nr:hypothetical protein [Sandaracinaceae bacterium]
MILELGLALGAGAALWAYRRRRAAKAGVAPAAAPDGSPDDPAPKPMVRKPGLNLSDVILYVDTELWLAGCLHLDDGADVLRLFAAPGGKRATHVAQLDRSGEDLAMLNPCADVPAGRVPDELQLGGARLRLRKRGRANVRAEGESLPDHRPQVDYVLLGDPSGRLLLVLDFVGGERLALLGERVPSGMLDLLPGG